VTEKRPYERMIPAELQPDLDRLERVIAQHGSMVIAYSGGVDSGLLVYVANGVLGDRALAAIGVSASLGGREERDARGFLHRHAIPHERIETDEMQDKRYRQNGPNRCYYCKAELFEKLRGLASARGLARVAYGANVDDAGDYRPGAKAALEHAVVAPLAEAGLGKDKIRALAHALHLELWDKPASPCLASRIPYRQAVTSEKLAQVEAAEGVLKDMGFAVCRVRHHGQAASIEVPVEDHARVRVPRTWREIMAQFLRAGFREVTLEDDGFRSGRLNDAIEGRPAARELRVDTPPTPDHYDGDE